MASISDPPFWIIAEQNLGLSVKRILEFRLLSFRSDWRFGREWYMECVLQVKKKVQSCCGLK